MLHTTSFEKYIISVNIMTAAHLTKIYKNLKELILWLSIFFFSSIVRIGAIIKDQTITRDSSMYLIQAEKWYDSQSYLSTFDKEIIVPPLPLWNIQLFMKSGLNSEICARSITMFLGFLLTIVCYQITKELFKNIIVALCSVFIFVVHPNLVEYSIQPLREIFYLFFYSLVILFSIQLAKGIRLKYYLYVGLSIACAIMCRYEAAEFIILFALYNVYIITVATSKDKIRLYLLISVCTALVFLIILNNLFGCNNLILQNFIERISSFY